MGKRPANLFIRTVLQVSGNFLFSDSELPLREALYGQSRFSERDVPVEAAEGLYAAAVEKFLVSQIIV
jgi:hypothetical protein